MSADQIVFAGRNVPKGTHSFSLFGADGKRRMARGPEGVDVGEFPIAELTADTILRVFGPGAYRVQFIGERKGQRRPLGSRIITVHPQNAQPRPDAAPVAADPAGLSEAFQILDAIDRRAQIQAERDRDFLRTVMEMGSRRNDDPVVTQLTAAVGQIATAVQGMQAQIAAMQGEPDDDDEDEDDDDDDDGEGGEGGDATPRGPFRPGEPIKDTIVAEGLNELAGLAKDLAPAAKEFFAAKLMTMATEMQQAAQQKELAQQQQQQRIAATTTTTTTSAPPPIAEPQIEVREVAPEAAAAQ